jgi:anti-anti-sigma factor
MVVRGLVQSADPIQIEGGGRGERPRSESGAVQADEADMSWTSLWTGTQFPRRSQFASIELKGSVLSAHIAGPIIGPREAPIVAGEVTNAMKSLGRPLRTLVLDFTDVQAVSSIGLGMCVDLCQQAKRLGGQTSAFGVTKELAEMLRLMKIDRLCRIVDSVDELNRVLAA